MNCCFLNLYRQLLGYVKTDIWRFSLAAVHRQDCDIATCASASHIKLTPTLSIRSERARAGIEPMISRKEVARSSFWIIALPFSRFVQRCRLNLEKNYSHESSAPSKYIMHVCVSYLFIIWTVWCQNNRTGDDSRMGQRTVVWSQSTYQWSHSSAGLRWSYSMNSPIQGLVNKKKNVGYGPSTTRWHHRDFLSRPWNNNGPYWSWDESEQCRASWMKST